MSYANKHKRDGLKNLLVELLKEGGALTLIFTVPGAAPYFMKPFMSGHDLDEKKFNRALNNLKKKQYISVSEEEGGVTLHLTEKGKKRAIRFNLDEMRINKPECWDGKWRLIMFDIPDSKKVGRNNLIDKLKELGFVTIQKSVYAHPFPCEDEIELIRSIYEIAPFVKVVLANRFEGEEKYLNKFGLARRKDFS